MPRKQNPVQRERKRTRNRKKERPDRGPIQHKTEKMKCPTYSLREVAGSSEAT